MHDEPVKRHRLLLKGRTLHPSPERLQRLLDVQPVQVQLEAPLLLVLAVERDDFRRRRRVRCVRLASRRRRHRRPPPPAAVVLLEMRRRAMRFSVPFRDGDSEG